MYWLVWMNANDKFLNKVYVYDWIITTPYGTTGNLYNHWLVLKYIRNCFCQGLLNCINYFFIFVLFLFFGLYLF